VFNVCIILRVSGVRSWALCAASLPAKFNACAGPLCGFFGLQAFDDLQILQDLNDPGTQMKLHAQTFCQPRFPTWCFSITQTVPSARLARIGRTIGAIARTYGTLMFVVSTQAVLLSTPVRWMNRVFALYLRLHAVRYFSAHWDYQVMPLLKSSVDSPLLQ